VSARRCTIRANGSLGGRLFLRLGVFIEQRVLGQIYLAETGFLVQRDPDVVLGPDIAFVRAERVPRRALGYVPLAPDLAVEIRSPSESRERVVRKARLYLTGGVRLLWYVDPRRQTVIVYRPGRAPTTLGIGDELDGEDVLPGFRLPVADVFG
jgi:Uma2 family endonuclease